MKKIWINVNTMLELGSEEAILLQAYKDSRKIWTWSVGITSASGHSVERYVDNPATMETALSVWVFVLQRYADDVLKAFDGYELKQHEFDAALSFHWNTGRIKTASWVGFVKAGKIAEARDAFMWWDQPKEIIPRRKRERELFFDGVYHNTGTISLIQKVDKNYRPIFSSAKKVDIRDALQALLGEAPAAAIVPMPAVVETPGEVATATPQVAEPAKRAYTLSDAWRSFNLWLIRVFG